MTSNGETGSAPAIPSDGSAVKWMVLGEEYHRHPAVSQSDLKSFSKDPALFREKKLTAERSGPTKSQQWGLDFERLIFFGEVPGVPIPLEVLSRSERDGKVVFSRRGAAWKEWQERAVEEYGPDVRLLKPDEYQDTVVPLLKARDRLRGHEIANTLLYGPGEPHIALLWRDEETGLDCRCQLDMIHGSGRPKVIVDLKTAANCSRDEFNRAVYNWGYHWQAAWYREAVKRWCGELLPMLFVVVQSSPSYGCEVYELDEEWLRLGEEKIRAALRKFAEARQKDRWETETYGKIVTLSPLPWMR